MGKNDPKLFVKAWKRIWDIFQEEGVQNVAFVWHSVAWPTFEGNSIDKWYPGDEYVHWIAASIYSEKISEDNLHQELRDVVEFAKEHKKPLMIAESGATGGVKTVEDWENWFVDYFNFIFKYNVKMFSYNNTHWDSWPGHKELDWGNSELQQSELISKAWHAVTNSDYFLNSSDSLFTFLDN